MNQEPALLNSERSTPACPAAASSLGEAGSSVSRNLEPVGSLQLAVGTASTPVKQRGSHGSIAGLGGKGEQGMLALGN